MLTIEINDSGVALVTIDMPDRAMNVIDWPMTDALTAAAEKLSADAAVTGVIIASAKTSFVVGADLAVMKDFAAPGMTPALAARGIARIGTALRLLERAGKPVVAAVSGTALGGGLELMLACHYRIAAQNDRALFGLPEVTLGLLPGAGGTQRLPRLIGVERALPILLSGAPLSVDEAFNTGILDEVVPADELIDAAYLALAEGRVPADAPWDRKGFELPGVGVNSSEGFGLFMVQNAAVMQNPGPSYPAPGAILSCLYEGLRLPIDKALRIEQEYFGRLATGPVAQALIETNFFARQRLAKRGVRKADPAAPVAAACREAIATEAEKITAEGRSANFVNTAAVSVGLTALLPVASVPEGRRAEADGLAQVARRLLLAGALAVAETDGDADEADITAIDVAGFPAWTGGPLAMIDQAGIAAAMAEAKGFGLLVPMRLREMAARGGRFREALA
ncbi:enoyl-CoA hydratase-related protein [Hoeflea sp. Naph1]|uniref:enoyl-CoA hydratase-related protein n=1 Tax=Hoeflea sp. Naph1 TaxID=3388653 RepID=UPI00398FA1E6